MQPLKFKPKLDRELSAQGPIEQEAWLAAEGYMAAFVKNVLHDAEMKADQLGKQMIDRTTVLSALTDPKYRFVELLWQTREEK